MGEFDSWPIDLEVMLHGILYRNCTVSGVRGGFIEIRNQQGDLLATGTTLSQAVRGVIDGAVDNWDKLS